jgi:CrcB protein
MPPVLWVCVGGAFGSGARYLLCNWIGKAPPQAFPLGTLAVNCGGSFLLALLMALSMGTAAVPPTLRVALAAGVLGGFTTFSTFSYETFVCLQAGDYGRACGNIAATMGGCLLATAAGWFVGRWLVG